MKWIYKLFSPRRDLLSYTIPIIRLVVSVLIYAFLIYLSFFPPQALLDLESVRPILPILPMVIFAVASFFLPVLPFMAITEILFTKDNIKAEREKKNGE